MGLSSALSTAVSGLTAAQTRAQTVANNIANANTDGYVRRTVSVSEKIVAGNGVGVQVDKILRDSDPYLTLQRMKLEGDNAFASERATAAGQIAALLGEPGATDGLFGTYARFEQALRDAAATPESTVLQRQVVDTAKDIIREFDELADRSVELRTKADTDIGRAVQQVNDALKRLEELNGLGGQQLTPDVLDERQRLIDDVNAIIPVEVQPVGEGIYLVTDSGVTLLATQAREIEFSPSVLVARNQTLGGGLSGLVVDGTDITPGSTSSQAIRGGQITALFETRDSRIPAFNDSLDALAYDLVSRFSDDSVDPTKTAGEVGLFTVGSATPPIDGDIGLASSLRLNAAIDPDQGGELYRIRDGLGAVAPGPAGNGDQINRLVDAFTGLQPTPGALGGVGQQSAVSLVSGLSSELNYDLQRREDSALYAGIRFDAAVNAEIAATGVDTDQELQQLILIEQAYAANAKVIETISSLVDQLIRIS
ncbi:flagellar hook-associated protein FlgK [Parvularcula marina]|uniref:flagellar hook-associated protein FlgK n=1 Tax=Parvularcula marina TaxID=2292771 RepID=UPI0035150162